MRRVTSPVSFPNSSERIAETFRSFFVDHGHLCIEGSTLAISGNSTSFVIAGMQPLMPYFSGTEVPPAPRLTDLQRCLRTDDVELVGSNTRKMSSFLMLGSWSIGDYGRREAISMSMELLDRLGIDRDRLWITVFGGDGALPLPPDEETVAEWLRIGVPRERLVALGAEDNFWSTGGPGPCGVDSEVFVDRGPEAGCGKPTCRPGCECDRFLEIWNLVFIEFEQHRDGSLTALPFASVDTGMGLERVAMVTQHAPSVFEIDLLAPALHRLDQLTPAASVPASRTVESSRQQSRRMIVDHMRSALFLGTSGIVPEHDGRGSVLRRLIRRAAARGRLMGISRPFLSQLLPPLVEAHGGLLTSVEQQLLPEVSEMVNLEEQRFSQILGSGLRLLDDAVQNEEGRISGEWLFQLQAERGFPADIAVEVLAQRGIQVEWSSFYAADRRHREVSRVKREK